MDELYLVAPKVAIGVAVLVALAIDSFRSDAARRWLLVAALASLACGLGFAVSLVGHEAATLWSGSVVIDRYSIFADIVLLSLGLLVTLAAMDGVVAGREAGDFLLLLYLALAGASVLASAGTLIVIFLAIELAIIPTFALVAFRAQDKRSFEAALKYFLMSVFASAVLLFGMSLLYGSVGSVIVPPPGEVTGTPLLYAGLGLLLVGFGFKLAAFPFHFWLPDAFEVSYAEVAAFLAVGPKLAAVVALVRILDGLADVSAAWTVAVAGVALFTMLWGNLLAFWQRGLKRMLAYSAVAQGGYALIGVAAGTIQGMEGAVLYFAVYGVAAVGAFLVVALRSREGEDDSIARLAGWGRVRPGMAAVLTVFLISLIGLPLFAGFWGKYSVFLGAVEGGVAWLAVAGALNSALSFGYYGNVIRLMYLEEPAVAAGPLDDAGIPTAGPPDDGAPESHLRAGWGLRVALGLSLVLTLLVGIVPGLLFGALG